MTESRRFASCRRLSGTAVFYEIKHRPDSISPAVLNSRKDVFLKASGRFRNYRIDSVPLSMDDM